MSQDDVLTLDSLSECLEKMKATPWMPRPDVFMGPAMSERQNRLYDDYMAHPERYDVRVEYVGEAIFISARPKEVSGCK